MKRTLFVAVAALAALLAVAGRALAYPDAEILGSGGASPPFDLGITAPLTGFVLISDAEMAVSYAETLALVDLGRYALETVQPPALDPDKENDGRLMAIAYDEERNDVLAAQDDGDLLVYDLDHVTNDPTSIAVIADAELGPIAFDVRRNIAYVSDNTNRVVYKVDINGKAVLATIALPTGVETFTVTDALWNEAGDEAWFATSVGAVLYIPEGTATATAVALGGTAKPTISAIALMPLATYVYALDAKTPAIYKINAETHQIVPASGDPVITIIDNPAPTDIIVADVLDPTATYGYVAGEGPTTGAITIFKTATDTVIDFYPDDPLRESYSTSAMPFLLASSSAVDGIVYMDYPTGAGDLGILSENPFIDITGLSFSDGSTTLKKNGSFTMTFEVTFAPLAAQTGTATVRAGGTTTGNGTLLKDSSGATSWAVTAATPLALTFNQADNAAAFEEGENDVWVFVDAGGTFKGRRSALVTVDTPPGNVVMRSIGFGSGRLYVNFDRLTASDMASYNIYADADPAAVMTKTDVAVAVAQASSGSSMTGVVPGLTNGTRYYIAMEGVDAGGNKSESRTNTLADGTAASGMPEQTVGPAGLLGESGCSLTGAAAPEGYRRAGSAVALLVLLLAATGLLRRQAARRVLAAAALVAALLLPALAQAQAVEQEVVEQGVSAYGTRSESPQMWSFEIGAGFWLPSNAVLDAFFTKCCNVMPQIRAGALFQKRYGVEGGVGFLYKSAAAVGVTSGQPSQDRFTLMLIPMETNFVWRADYFSWRYLVPYLRTGIDYVYFREKDVGTSVQGMKYGMHGEAGLMINVGDIGDASEVMDADTGINDLFLTLSARYQWINNFGGKGLDLSGGVYAIALLVEF